MNFQKSFGDGSFVAGSLGQETLPIRGDVSLSWEEVLRFAGDADYLVGLYSQGDRTACVVEVAERLNRPAGGWDGLKNRMETWLEREDVDARWGVDPGGRAFAMRVSECWEETQAGPPAGDDTALIVGVGVLGFVLLTALM